MKKCSRVAWMAVLALLLVAFLPGAVQAAGQEVSVAELKDLRDQENVAILDLRQESEYIGWAVNSTEGGHIKGAYDFPADWLEMLESDGRILTELKRKEIEPGMDLVLYDTDEVDKAVAAKFEALGFKVSTLQGGINQWIAEADEALSKMDQYQMLVYPEWVYNLSQGNEPETADGKDFKIIEISFGDLEAEYEKGHIPGALHVDNTTIEVPGPQDPEEFEDKTLEEKASYFRRPSDEAIAQMLKDLGIKKDTLVVIYGPFPYASTRLAMIMKYAGVEDVRVLNGGTKRYLADDLPLEEGIVEAQAIKKLDFEVPANPNYIIDLEEEKALVDDPDAVIASVRSWQEYIGEEAGIMGEAGDIPNACFAYAGSSPFTFEDFRNVDETLFNYSLVEERWAKWGITPDKKVSMHCATGWRASETQFYALAMGWPNVYLYDGSWYEWSLYEELDRKEKGVPQDAPEIPDFFYHPEPEDDQAN